MDRMWYLLLVALGALVDLTLSYSCGENRCTCYPNMDLIDCRNQFLQRFPSDFTTNDKTYTQFINLQGNQIVRMELNLPEWKSLRLINLEGNPINCKWLDKQDWKILVKSSCKLTVDEPWEDDWIAEDDQKKPSAKGEDSDEVDDDYYDDGYYDDYEDDDYYDDDAPGQKKSRKASGRFGGPPSAGTIAAAVIVTLVGLIAIVFGILYFMKRNRETGQRRRLDNIMTSVDEE